MPLERSHNRACDLTVKEVRIQDFRAIEHLTLPLGAMTVLIGENNSGKTSILEALGIALGGGRASEDDLRRQLDGTVVVRCSLIDVRIGPAAGTEFSSEITQRFGPAVRGIAEGSPYVAIRTVIQHKADGSGIDTQRTFLKDWSHLPQGPDDNKLGSPSVSRRVMELVSFQLLTASRDVVEELRNRSSNWSRLIADLGIEAPLRGELEKQIIELSERIISSSTILKKISVELKNVIRALAAGVSEVSVEPLPGRLSELARGIGVVPRHRTLRRYRCVCRAWELVALPQ